MKLKCSQKVADVKVKPHTCQNRTKKYRLRTKSRMRRYGSVVIVMNALWILYFKYI